MNKTLGRSAMAALGSMALAFGLGLAPAAAAPTTVTEHGGVDVFADTRPCDDSGQYYRITATYNEIDHESDNHFTFTQTASFTAVPSNILRDANGDPVLSDEGDAIPIGDPLPGETFTGHYTVWDGGNLNSHSSTDTFTFNITGTGSEGTTFSEHSVSHVTAGPGDPEDPSTIIHSMFQKDVCN